MPTSFIRFLILAAVFLTTSSAAPSKLILAVTDSNGQSFGGVIVFDGQFAFEYGDGINGVPLATYDLVAPAWTDQGGQKISLEQAKAWAADSKQRALASLGKVTDPGQKAFTEMLLDPIFKITADENQIQLDSQYLEYTASEPLPVETKMMQAYFAYDELNAYRKAMVLRRAPPFPQLSVSGLLKDKAMFPGRLVMELHTPRGEVQVVTTLRWAPLTPEELTEFQKPRS